jgi:putative SOS response-associated peptidase YedK
MCYRYTITVLPSHLELWLNVKTPDTYKPRFNAAPSQYLPIIANDNLREVIMGYWGFQNDVYSDTLENRKEYLMPIATLKKKRSWQNLLQTNRCLILADGFYCWKQISKKKKVPYRIIPNHKKLICFAGIWEEFTDYNTNTRIISFIIITRSSYRPVNEISDVMPVIIESGIEMKWLEGKNMNFEELMDIMEMEDWAFLEYYSVSPAIDNIKIDKPDLIKRVPASDQHGNLTLFD